ncbi:hypothetical protein [Neorhizobium sp. NCHU2750]|uniref:hypothetical protein n=1 Tax=Neorhizobium sp. NCHU2750 TaxID=1825976 RepID=UPI000EB65E70|nr:hypothetical protein NCHU2750_15460 [Neorhizobium sp. NCHU2750]
MREWAKQVNWLWAAGGFTIVYLVGSVLIIGPIRITTHITTGALNEIGDFLSGIFSPLAFIWLVAAVLTQRQELDETRDQFAKGQDVIDGQMQNITKQNALLVMQHNQAQESAKQTYRLNLFDKRFEIYNELLAVKRSMESKPMLGSEWQDLERIAKKSSFVFSSDISSYLEYVAEAAFELIIFVEQNQSAWHIDAIEGGEYPTDDASISARRSYLREKLGVEEKISMNSLNELMWSSLRVTDA